MHPHPIAHHATAPTTHPPRTHATAPTTHPPTTHHTTHASTNYASRAPPILRGEVKGEEEKGKTLFLPLPLAHTFTQESTVPHRCAPRVWGQVHSFRIPCHQLHCFFSQFFGLFRIKWKSVGTSMKKRGVGEKKGKKGGGEGIWGNRKRG